MLNGVKTEVFICTPAIGRVAVLSYKLETSMSKYPVGDVSTDVSDTFFGLDALSC